ncbi:FeoC-like transcriptional regulator [Parathermosynechococcus lividus]
MPSLGGDSPQQRFDYFSGGLIVLLQVQSYIKEHHVVSMAQLATHFDKSPAVLEPLLVQLIRKGRLEKLAAPRCGGCHQCHSTDLDLYQWRSTNAINCNDQSPERAN